MGPNGSGKSNVIDSMLFVFGYRAQKLRSKKLSVLIHNSDQYPDCTSCEVKVHFAILDDKGGDEYILVPNSEFVVSRTANKDNSSNYYINGRRVQFKEVSKLLQSHGVDLRYNRFLILQGEVEQIALMKPKAESEHDTGMLEFLEDIIGTTRLKEPLVKLLQKVDETNDVRAEKLNRVKVVEKEKQALEEPRNEAIRYIETKNEIALKHSALYQVQKHEVSGECDQARADYERAKKIYDDAMAEANSAKEERDVKEAEMAKFNEQYEKHVKKTADLKAAFKDLEKRDAQTREKIKHTKAKGKKLVDDREKEEEAIKKTRKVPEKIEKEIEDLQQQRVGIEQRKLEADKVLEKEAAKLKDDTQRLQKEKEPYQKELLQLQDVVQAARAARELALNEHELYVGRERTEKEKLTSLQSKYESMVREIEDGEKQIKLLTSKLPQTTKQLDELNKRAQQLEEQRAVLDEEQRATTGRMQEIRLSTSSSQSRNKLVTSIMDAKKKGQLHGVLGRLGDLGAINKKYDIAISTACGALDNMVVDTIDNAQALITYLKQHNLGKTTCIALDQLRISGRDMNNAPGNSEDIPRLFDLVQIEDERVRPAFYFALRNTLVADDLTQATRVKGRHRIVTLDGKMVEASGAMSGGGRPLSGRMGTSVAVRDTQDQDVSELEARLREIRQEMENVAEQLKEIQRERDQVNKDHGIMADRLPKLEMDMVSRQKAAKEAKELMERQERVAKEAAPDPNQVKALKKTLDAKQKEYDEKAAQSDELEEKVTSIEEAIKKITEEGVGEAKRNATKLKSELKSLDNNISKLNVALTTAKRNVEKSEEKLKQIDQEIENSHKLIDELRAEMKKLEEEANEVNKNFEEAESMREDMEKEFKKFNHEISELKQKEEKLHTANVDAKHEVERMSEELKEHEKKLAHFDGLMQTLELDSIEDSQPMFPVLTPEEMQDMDVKSIKHQIESLNKEFAKMKPNLAAIEEYKKKDALYLERFRELEEVTKTRDMYKTQYEEVRQQRMAEFKNGFLIITRKLKEMYRMITAGGDAELEWSDSLDPFAEGIHFSVRPNKKSWKRISNLSGGEKTLSSLALIFALHYFKPSPLYVMDEIDAALDFKNVSIVANYIKERTRNTQFIIISLRNNMYELGDRLVGIYKTFNCTKSATFNPVVFEEGLRTRGVILPQSQTTRGHRNPFRHRTDNLFNLDNNLDNNRDKENEPVDNDTTLTQ